VTLSLSQTCDIVFISWTFSGHELNVSFSKSFENWIYYKSENQVGEIVQRETTSLKATSDETVSVDQVY